MILKSIGQRSRSPWSHLWKPFPDNNWSSISPTVFKLHIVIVLIKQMVPIVFGIKRSRSSWPHLWNLIHDSNRCSLWPTFLKLHRIIVYLVDDPYHFLGQFVKCQGHLDLIFESLLRIISCVPYDQQCSNFAGWLYSSRRWSFYLRGH